VAGVRCNGGATSARICSSCRRRSPNGAERRSSSPRASTSKAIYLVTNKRVLIQRRFEELHLDRSKILDVIEAPKGGGLYDLFLVLDGPRARAVAASGAFGEIARGPNLRPVFEAVEDAEGVSKILRDAAA
jgi:hypothetical protein